MSEKKKMKPRFSSEESDSSSDTSSLSSSSDEETDAKDLKLIKDYLPNRKDLASQLFKSVKAEKIRMMLPQSLKKIDFKDLEELCAAELIGMSKTRVMSVINGQEMLQSSDTNDSDNSGPSLEIISDTEWLSDNETNIKVEGAKHNKDSKKLKKKFQDLKSRVKLKGKVKVGKDTKVNVKVKAEKIKTESKEKEKEGESLLDLLELEMRARAIRALIRKEEDPSNSIAKNDAAINSANAASGSATSNDKTVKAREVSLKEQLEKIDVLMKHGEDEDVYVVINPAPTIELLSSESDTEDHSKRVNQKLVNECTSESKKGQEKEKPCTSKDTEINVEKDVSKEKNQSSEKNINNKEQDKEKESKEAKNENENLNLPISVIESNLNNQPENSNKTQEKELEEGEIIDDDDDQAVSENAEVPSDSPSKRKIKKVKKNPHIRSRRKSKESNTDKSESNEAKLSGKETDSEDESSSSKKKKAPAISEEPIEIEESPTRQEEIEEILDTKESKKDSSIIDLLDDKSLDIEEIINLDDYPDDMDDLEGTETSKKTKDDNKPTESSTEVSNKNIDESSLLISETWATRYYQQDDVQNVIKESKIQSEIRKRLRERQRLRKMNNSPKLKEPSPEPVILKPTGSVKEYLALKALSNPMSSSVTEERAESIEASSSSPLNNGNPSTEQDNPSLSTHGSKGIEQSVMIVKKAKLIENRTVVTKVDSTMTENTIVEQSNEAVEKDNSVSTKSEASTDHMKSLSRYQKSIVVKDDSLLKNKKIILVKTNENTIEPVEKTESSKDAPHVEDSEDNSSSNNLIVMEDRLMESNEKSEQTELSNIKLDTSLTESETASRSDSSDDNVIVKIGDIFSKSTQPFEESINSTVEPTEQSDSKISELRPD